MTEEMQTEIKKRIEEYISKLGMTHDRNTNPNVISPNSIKLGAKFIIEMPELREAVEALEFYGNTTNWEHHNNQKPLDWGRPIISYDDCKHVYSDEWCSYGGDKARQALSKIKSLGIVKEGGK